MFTLGKRAAAAEGSTGDSRAQTLLAPPSFLQPQLHLQDVRTVQEVLERELLPPLRPGPFGLVLGITWRFLRAFNKSQQPISAIQPPPPLQEINVQQFNVSRHETPLKD